jgi:hypothetical protein
MTVIMKLAAMGPIGGRQGVPFMPYCTTTASGRGSKLANLEKSGLKMLLPG